MVNQIKTVGKKIEVWKGTALKTSGGLKKKDLVAIRRKDGSIRVVSKAQRARGFALAKKFPPKKTQAPRFTKKSGGGGAKKSASWF